MALVGADGAAKSRLCRAVAGEEPPPRGMVVDLDEAFEGRVRLVSFAQQRAAASRGGFMQARYHSLVDDAGPGDTVADVLGFSRVFDVNPFEVGRSYRKERRAYAAARRRIAPLFRLDELMDRPFLALSNGETRRVQLARALLADPALLVLDDPCAGLDPGRREQLKSLLDELAAQGMAILVAVRHEDEMPSCVTRVVMVGRSREGRKSRMDRERDRRECREGRAVVPAVPVVELRDIRIAFGRRKLFDGFSWTVRRGERWVLCGPNGSGKTTLLSLITGDNPLAYANDVTVFGIRRGPGAELARVRRRIGMVSPEQQAYLGLGADELLDAALRKRPDLLLLDEPCQNLDATAASRLCRRVARYLASRPDCAAICVAHRPDDVPPGFSRRIDLQMACEIRS
ncbi:MAG: ATP-binding cassette domain-containing protein [Kiritimatiellae bacterium]|nr:ATP-binding cassette domain-containing protein [Kiritimatiellia bacterium]